ncbi:hypothetical protein FCOIX_11226 [Fusarium coicis]|nr:hypothetical protein FCOIX_11226 [Fusarium coicis]
MARLSNILMLLSVAGGFAAAQYDQEKENKDATCDNDCFFKYFTNKCNADNPACVCTLKDMREKFFCCIAKNCAENVLPGTEQIERSSSDCDAHGIPFTFDAEAVCGIKFPVSSETVSVSVTTSEATTVPKAKATEAVTTTEEETTKAMTKATGTENSAASQTTLAAAATVTDNSASRAKGMVAAAAVALGVLI